GLALACENLGRECASTAICFGMHCVGTAVIAAHATDEQVKRYLIPIAQGEHITTLSLSERGTGVFFFFPQTRIKQRAENFELSGGKHFVTNGSHADSYVVSGSMEGESTGNADFSCIILDRDVPGLNWNGQWSGIGMRGNSSIAMQMNNVSVPTENLLGKVGDQIMYVFQVVAPYFLAAMAGTYLGVAQRALDEAIEHISRRVYGHSGGRVSDAPVVQHRLGELWARVHRNRCALHHSTLAFDRGEENAILGLLAAKADIAECVVTTVNEAMTLCGGVGYSEGTVLERLLRDSRASHVMAPTTDLLRIWTGRALLGQPLLAE
ncbi:MAG: acyl-CoA dehydrogenase family protein, partial [Oceanococcus sp.]